MCTHTHTHKHTNEIICAKRQPAISTTMHTESKCASSHRKTKCEHNIDFLV